MKRAPRPDLSATVADALLEAAGQLTEAAARLRRDAAAVRAGRLVAAPYAIGGGRNHVLSATTAALEPLAALEAAELEAWNTIRDAEATRHTTGETRP